jgi:hypothetical protein
MELKLRAKELRPKAKELAKLGLRPEPRQLRKLRSWS